ncbi:hypothetical protein Nepgr_006959 [Nepenthes gracilis]|uniref:Uncharacterized protein n=1 Tax=Nepenthes gracilis TaxID=150966 RepID=A0AAD3S667_NEPGR|nr:hypothetical protein Nepgr_006959 [Nepenthes gracilis]
MVKQIKGRFPFLSVFLVFAILALSFAHGNGRELMATAEEKQSTLMSVKEKSREPRNAIELMDYDDAGPNVNTRSGIYSPPPPPPPPPPSPSPAMG